MAVLRIRTAPDPVLRRKTSRVTRVDASIRKLIGDMIDTMRVADGVGLAASQVGVSLRIAVIEIPEPPEEKTLFVLINPEIVKKVGERELEEGCLSIPGYRGALTRAVTVKVKARDAEGKELRIKAEGLLAQALEHEIDHLDGILYIDRMKEQGTLDTLHSIETHAAEEAAAG